ncbi:MAG: chemotaxis protein, partial [Lachnospiraceae bacterium]|nr:chemotaxis protein [Lachnospiraceae bacterium]
MAKRKEDTPPPGYQALMATFGDLMNLLFCCYVILFSMSTID